MHLEETIFETFILILMVNGTKSDGTKLMSKKGLIKNLIAQSIMM